MNDNAKTKYQKLSDTVWWTYLPWLMETTAMQEHQCRPIIGRWLRDYGASRVIASIAAAQSAKPDRPIPWITEWLLSRKHLADGYEDEAGLEGWERRVRRVIAKTRGEDRADIVYEAYLQREQWAMDIFMEIGNQLKAAA